MSEIVHGLGVSPGIALGPAFVLTDTVDVQRDAGTPE